MKWRSSRISSSPSDRTDLAQRLGLLVGRSKRRRRRRQRGRRRAKGGTRDGQGRTRTDKDGEWVTERFAGGGPREIRRPCAGPRLGKVLRESNVDMVKNMVILPGTRSTSIQCTDIQLRGEGVTQVDNTLNHDTYVHGRGPPDPSPAIHPPARSEETSFIRWQRYTHSHESRSSATTCSMTVGIRTSTYTVPTI